jgi:hypothetical protein
MEIRFFFKFFVLLFSLIFEKTAMCAYIPKISNKNLLMLSEHQAMSGNLGRATALFKAALENVTEQESMCFFFQNVCDKFVRCDKLVRCDESGDVGQVFQTIITVLKDKSVGELEKAISDVITYRKSKQVKASVIVPSQQGIDSGRDPACFYIDVVLDEWCMAAYLEKEQLDSPSTQTNPASGVVDGVANVKEFDYSRLSKASIKKSDLSRLAEGLKTNAHKDIRYVDKDALQNWNSKDLLALERLAANCSVQIERPPYRCSTESTGKKMFSSYVTRLQCGVNAAIDRFQLICSSLRSPEQVDADLVGVFYENETQ